MSLTDQPTDPIIMMKRGNDTPYVNIVEEVYVSSGKAVLTEIPYKRDRVQILKKIDGNSTTTGIDGGSFTDGNQSISETVTIPIMYEIDSGSPNDNQYVVDYVEGVITFNVSQEGVRFLVTYTGTGYHFYPSSRVYYKQNADGTLQTIEDVLNTSTQTISNIQTAENNATTAANNANSATANFQSLLDQQKLVYKQSVATFSAIATTYPTPSLGWRVVAKDTGIAYRYDGTAWIEVDMSTTSEGFNVTISDAAPANTNVLWLNVPNVNQTTRVVQSNTAPADTSVIWWEP
jgi:hypothetical protein